MKKLLLISIVLVSLFANAQETKLKDGVYVGKSRYIYQEPYLGITKLTIVNGYIKTVEFCIKDTLKNELFDEKYESHYAGNEEYIQQCRNDWKGVKTYPTKLLEKKDIEKVDAVSGATWSYNLFKHSVKDALNKAKKK